MNGQDEFAGMGGSYTVDANGKRSLVERTKEPEATPQPDTQAQAAPADADTTLPPVKKFNKGA